MAERKAVYFVVVSGVEVADALGTPAHIVGPVKLRSEAIKQAQDLIPADTSVHGYDVVKAHFVIVDTFKVAPMVVASFVSF